jgi:hypothetical protein
MQIELACFILEKSDVVEDLEPESATTSPFRDSAAVQSSNPCAASSVIPMMAFIGVRTSYSSSPELALASLAASALARASSELNRTPLEITIQSVRLLRYRLCLWSSWYREISTT